MRTGLWRALSPSQLFVGSFAGLILLGTVVLALFDGLYTGAPLGWIDALFTATSAVCVTGLIVVDTASYFTFSGQAVVLALIQLGGLGVVTFTTLIILALGQRISLRTQELSMGHAMVIPDISYRRLTRDIVRYTLVIEGAGAFLLFLGFLFRTGPLEAAWHAVFHAVSAFCNAGFSTFSDSLIGYQTDPDILIVVMLLIVAGGIGFLTIEEVNRWRRSHRAVSDVARFRFSLHSRLVLATTGVLIGVGWILFLVFEWSVSLDHVPGWARALNALFMSVTARTAGFNTVDYVQTSDSSNLLTMLLMSIGGSPGSTAGGIKTTTVALILLFAWARLRGRARAGAWGRTVPGETVQRSVGLFVLASIIVTLSFFVLIATELEHLPHAQVRGEFVELLFEVVSAFNTVGLSMGATAGLSVVGKLTVIALMFLVRVGPLTFAAALARRTLRSGAQYRYAEEDVIIG